MKEMKKIFPLGEVVTTAFVASFMEENSSFAEFVRKSLMRHVKGDWGELSKGDARENNRALTSGDRILSSYEMDSEAFGIEEHKLWIITEADRSSTCILLPSEY